MTISADSCKSSPNKGVRKSTPSSKRPIGGGASFSMGKPKIGGGGFGGPKKALTKPKAASTSTTAATSSDSVKDEIGAHYLIELKLDGSIETMLQEDENDKDISNIVVSLLPMERDTLFNNEYKLKFEYGFREKMKAPKLRGGNGPKNPKKKKEKVGINLGQGGAAEKDKSNNK